MSSSPARGSKTTSSSSLSSRSLLARLKSPLQSKTRNFTEFSIQPDDPHRQYSPGDIITGSVIIKVLKPLRITHLVISLHGYAQVFKNPNSPGDAYRNYSSTVGSGKGKKSGSYFGNGFASLFEDEAVLCGEGRLGEGIYHFNFELEFPSKGLPSSIDFERGTISYMLTATLTRPTTISPTTSTDSKVYLVDAIDIAPISEPKPRVISLEPISRRTRTAKGVRRRATIAETTNQSDSSGSTTRNGRVSELNSVAEESDTPGSPAPSDVSFESHISSGGGSGTEYGIRSVNTINTAEGSTSNVNKTTLNGKTITATIEMLKGGFLRGDQIPIHIEISHTKHVRSLKGIIITLYRQARVDMHPALPVAANSKGDKTKSEDYYPKSKTGLGGLSLSSAGSSHLFRKDLSQSFAPLFVDPRTLTADVKCAVRVPDEAFPTISNVPGAMISFKYFVEVVVDIQGKLTGLDRMFPNAGLINVPTTYGSTPGQGRAEDTNGSMFSTWGGNFADTDAIRREKGVISCIFEVVIGTKDSERNGKKKQQPHDAGLDGQGGVYEIPPRASNDTPYMSGGNGQDWYGYEQDAQYYDGYGYDESYQAGYYEDSGYRDTDGSHPPYVPPDAGNEEVSEKEQLRRAEARLLPSQPPEGSGPSSPPTTQQGIPASAPVLPEDDDPHPPYFPPESCLASSSRHPPPFTSNAPSASSHPPSFVAGPSSPPTHPSPSLRNADDDTRTNVSSHTITTTSRPPPLFATASHPDPNKPLPSRPPPSPAPQYFPSAAASSSAFVQPTDDKQELQRRRLELERSAPPPDHDNDDENIPATAGPSAPPPTAEMQNLGLAPSAPVLHEDDEGLVGPVSVTGRGEETGRRRSEALPVYER